MLMNIYIYMYVYWCISSPWGRPKGLPSHHWVWIYFFWETLCWGELINHHFTCQEDLFRELILARKLVLGEQLSLGQTWFRRNIILGRIWLFSWGNFWRIIWEGTWSFAGNSYFRGSTSRSAWQAAFQIPFQSSHGFVFGTSRKLGVELQHIALRLKSNWGLFKWGEGFFFSSHQVDERLRLIETRCFFF